jgi:hypothetical protein
MGYNKKKCVKCKYHGYFGSKSYVTSDESAGRFIMCDYAKYTGRTCLYSEHGKVKDRRGVDSNNCKLYEPGNRPHMNRFNGDPRKEMY